MVYQATKFVYCISGLPHRNGDRHAPEIATMALDIVDSLSQLEIPHIPGNNLLAYNNMSMVPYSQDEISIFK